MNTIKTIFVTATLLAVGYGTHVVLNNPSGSSPLSASRIWDHKVTEAPGIPNTAIEIPELRQTDPLATTTPELDNPFSSITPPSPQASNPFARSESDSSSGSDRVQGARPNLHIEQYTQPDYNPTAPQGQGATNLPPSVLADTRRPLAEVPPIHSSNQPTNGMASNAKTTGPVDFGLPQVTSPLTPNNEHSGANLGPTANPVPPLGQLTMPSPTQPGTGAAMNYQQPIVTPAAAPFTPAIPTAEDKAAFAQTWQSTQALIGRGELADALATLSSIYNLPMVGADRGQLVGLLDQLAGTVIYSQQHLLHAAYAPRHGETTAQIAVRQRVPADFLARVNGINPHHALSPDMQLKIVTGPFRAEISRTRRELTVFLGKHYAGRFAISLGSDFPQQVSAFEVIEKSGARAYIDPRTGQPIPAGDPSNPYGAHWIGMRVAGVPGASGATYGMHSVGTNIDAADSRGCVGLTENDADDLKAILELGSTVTIVD